MSLLNPDLTNLEIKIDSIVVCKREQTLINDGEEPFTRDFVICLALKANRNDIIFKPVESIIAATHYGMYILTAEDATTPYRFDGLFKCKSNGVIGMFTFENVLSGAGTLATITLDESNEGGEGGDNNG